MGVSQYTISEKYKGRCSNKKNMNKLWNWLVKSSADPTRVSLTMKSVAPLVLFLAAFLKLDVGMGDWDKLIEAIVAIISGFAFIYGFGRKIVFLLHKRLVR